MSNSLSVSVVIPVYNEAEVLSACLDSLLAQIDDIAEIIIVDNNSTDDSRKIAGRYIAAHPKVRLVEEKKQGLVPTRNRGFMEAGGKIIARIDADTRVCPGWAAEISRYFTANPDVAAITGETRYYDLPFEDFTAKISHLIVERVNGAIAGSACLYGPNMAIRADDAKWLAKVSCDENGRLNEDLDLTIHLSGAGRNVTVAPKMAAYISGRRLKSSPVNFVPYCLNWPRTYRLHKQYSAAAMAYLLSVPFCLAMALLFLPLRAYDDEKMQFKWRRMFALHEDRVIP